ncbi:hypothetical protein Pla108_32470 [Botrimarina colliarenosi]|uniref:Uncharacterized protein n=1 Tax=Botrimarina colliarenosi TaxID=2528001 RepID=A0A5C6A9S3_9BACT|nr:hypothetical protein [Botrimarina colliarenosi]TWT96160.1 hypothetical protein Pla108_32470 [Botrimarina colliarenosi]
MSRPPFRYRLADWFARRARDCGYFWDRLVGPFERLFGRLGEGVFTAFDSFEGLESFVVRLVRVLFWPLLAPFRLIGRFLPKGGGPFQSLGAAVGRFAGGAFHLAERLNLDGLLLFIGKLLTPIWWPIGSLLGFINAWLATRLTRELLLAAPALLFALPFGYVAVQGAMLGKGQIAERYKIGVREAAEAGDYQTVSLLERKLAQLGVDTRRSDYRTAVALAEDGDLVAAYQRMQRLAPEDHLGYPPAHFWVVQRLITGALNEEHDPRLAEGREAALAIADRHLKQLDELGVKNVGLAQMKGYVFALTGRQREAVDVLQPFSREPNVAPMRLRLLAQLRDIERARDQAKVVLEIVSEPRWKDSATSEGYEAWALAAELLNNSSQIEAALKEWSNADSDDKRPRELLANYRRQQTLRLLGSATTSPERTVDVLIDAVRLGAPAEWIDAVTNRLAELRRVSRHGERVWNELMAREDLPNGLVFTLATAAAAQGDIAAAREGFHKLVEAETTEGVVWNNYAWTLLQEPDPDPVAALAAVTRAIELKPGDFRFRETRGQTFIALSRWEEAIDDLEFALNGMPESPEVHRSLASAYEATSHPQLAEIHRRHAEK